jgi:hypothetical protein
MSQERTMIEATRVILDRAMKYDRFLSGLLFTIREYQHDDQEKLKYLEYKIERELKIMRGEKLC